MKIYDVPRGCGKSTKCILDSAKTGYPIICADNNSKSYILEKARELNKEIETYTCQECLEPEFWRGRRKPERIIIDELPMVLNQIFGTEVEFTTMSCSYSEWFKKIGIK